MSPSSRIGSPGRIVPVGGTIQAGVALQAIGIGWLAHEITPAVPYAHLVPPFIVASAGLGFFFAPITQLTLRYAPGRSRASPPAPPTRCARSAPRWASPLGSVFSATGGLDGPGQFTAGLTNALGVSAGLLAVAALVVLLAPET